jgi:cyanocobalamin reductase (cyanide-eliminating) / alkylcobalamin dealkylase
VLVLGNTIALWPHIEAAVADGVLDEDPVDVWTTRVVTQALAEVAVIDLRFTYEPPPRRLAFQRLADLAGLAWLSPAHLCVHETYGPWIALRAAVVLDEPAPAAMGSAARPACDCSIGCVPALHDALEAGELVEHWRLWLAMRDACPVGRSWRYSDEQLEYHYTGKRPAHWPSRGAGAQADGASGETVAVRPR